jgi:hypothetical protein
MMRAMTADGAAADLFGAIAAGDEAGALGMIEAQPELASARHASGVGVVLWAMYHGRRELARRVAERRGVADVFEAAALGRCDRLVESEINAAAPDGFSPLGLACFFGAEEAVGWLIARGADVDRVSANAMQVAPLHSAVTARNEGIVRRLLEAGAAASPRQHGGWTPLHSAARNGDGPIVDLLLEHGAERAARSDDGKTPADMADAAGQAELAKKLRT